MVAKREWRRAVPIVLAAALLAGVAPLAPAQRVSVRIRDTTVEGDSALRRGAVFSESIEQLINELLASRQIEERVALALRGEDNATRAQELERELGRVSRRTTALGSIVELRCAKEDAPPEGYLGVTFGDVRVLRRSDEPAVYELGELPTILSVEPGSPAEKSGMQRGDRVLTVGGRDTRRPIALATILKPGARVSVRVQRQGQPKEFTLVVAKRPPSFGVPCAAVDDMAGPDHPAPMALFFRSPPAPPGAGRAPRPAPAAAADVHLQPPPSGAWGLAPVPMGFSSVAGAQLAPVDEDWSALVGVDKGLVILQVSPGSPAKEAGLRKGDVIVAAGDSPVSAVGMLQRIVNDSESRSLKLQVVRGGRTQSIVLRWE